MKQEVGECVKWAIGASLAKGRRERRKGGVEEREIRRGWRGECEEVGGCMCVCVCVCISL